MSSMKPQLRLSARGYRAEKNSERTVSSNYLEYGVIIVPCSGRRKLTSSAKLANEALTTVPKIVNSRRIDVCIEKDCIVDEAGYHL